MPNANQQPPAKEKTYLNIMPVNLQQGLLVDNCTEPQQIFGAYNSEKKVFVIKEGWVLNDFSLPEEIKGYIYNGVGGHFAVTYLDFKTNSEVNI